jgi:ABC-type uncharacterized transport system permease subunit
MAICGYIGIVVAVGFVGVVAVLVGVVTGRLTGSTIAGAVTVFLLAAGLNVRLLTALYHSSPPNAPPEVAAQALSWCLTIGSVLTVGCGVVASAVTAVAATVSVGVTDARSMAVWWKGERCTRLRRSHLLLPLLQLHAALSG